MPETPGRKSSALLLRLITEAATWTAKDHPDSRTQEVGVRANRAVCLMEKANREGRAGIRPDGKGGFVIVEK